MHAPQAWRAPPPFPGRRSGFAVPFCCSAFARGGPSRRSSGRLHSRGSKRKCRNLTAQNCRRQDQNDQNENRMPMMYEHFPRLSSFFDGSAKAHQPVYRRRQRASPANPTHIDKESVGANAGSFDCARDETIAEFTRKTPGFILVSHLSPHNAERWALSFLCISEHLVGRGRGFARATATGPWCARTTSDRTHFSLLVESSCSTT